MANELQFNLGETGRTVYAVARNAAGQAWNGSAFATYTTTRDDFDIPLAPIGVTGHYGPEDLPGTGAGRWWEIYLQAGGAPSHTDDVWLAVGYNTAADAAAAAWTNATRTLTAGTNIVLAKGVGVTGFNDIAAGAEMNLADGAITANKIATAAFTAAKFAAGAFDAVWSVAVRLLTAGTNIVLAKGVGVTGFNDPAAGAIADAVWDEAQSGHTNPGTFGLFVDSAISGVSTGGVSAGEIADAVWDEARAGHVAAGSFGQGVASVVGNVSGNVVGSVDSVTAPVTVVTNNDKTGYSLTQGFPANFAALVINASGHVSRVTLVDTTTANTDMRGTNNALLASSYVVPPTANQNAAAVAAQTDIAAALLTIETNLDAPVSGITASLDPQEVRDAMKLAPSAGVPAPDSIDDKLDDVVGGGTAPVQLDNTDIVSARVFKLGARRDGVAEAAGVCRMRPNETYPIWIDTTRFAGGQSLENVTDETVTGAGVAIDSVGVNREMIVVWLDSTGGVLGDTAVVSCQFAAQQSEEITALVNTEII